MAFLSFLTFFSSPPPQDSLFHKILVEEWFCNQREGAGKTKEKKGGKKVDKKGGGGGGGGGAGEYLEGILAPGQIAALKECLRGQKEWSEERITEIWKELGLLLLFCCCWLRCFGGDCFVFFCFPLFLMPFYHFHISM